MKVENKQYKTMNKKEKNNEGFTLLELLLVIAMIAILVAVVIIAINPNKQLADARNTQRRQDILTIINAVYQFTLDNNGNLPEEITTTQTEICLTGTDTASATCGSLIDLEPLTNNERYVIRIPVDPSGATNTYGTGYQIVKTANNRVSVIAVASEQSQDIIVTR